MYKSTNIIILLQIICLSISIIYIVNIDYYITNIQINSNTNSHDINFNILLIIIKLNGINAGLPFSSTHFYIRQYYYTLSTIFLSSLRLNFLLQTILLQTVYIYVDIQVYIIYTQKKKSKTIIYFVIIVLKFRFHYVALLITYY